MHFDLYTRHYGLDLIAAYSNGFTSRVLVAFADIEAEAKAAADAYWNESMKSPASDENSDPGQIAEAAFDRGFTVYSDLRFVRNQVIGLAIAGLYHLWERLVREFLSRELARDNPKYMSKQDLNKAGLARLVGVLTDFGWPVRKMKFYPALDRLNLVANVVKHANGRSFDVLFKKAPEMFHDFGHEWLNAIRATEGLELNVCDFTMFVLSVREFFEQFPEVLELRSA